MSETQPANSLKKDLEDGQPAAPAEAAPRPRPPRRAHFAPSVPAGEPSLGQLLRQRKGLVLIVTCVVILIIIGFAQLVYLQTGFRATQVSPRDSEKFQQQV